MSLAKAKSLLAAKKPEEALAPLLAVWRECHDLALADVIDRVSAQVQRPELKGSAKARHEEFLTLAKKKDPADIGRLYAFLGEGQIAHWVAELDALKDLPPDPRFTPRALDLLQKPKVTSSTSFTAWRRLFNQLVENADLRALAALKTFDFRAILGPGQEYSAQFFEERRVKVIAALEKVKPAALAPADAALVKELGGAQKSAARDLTSLEAAVYASPDDDAPRQVFCDALLERGDPRGEFISLQLKAGRLSMDERLREFALLEEHRDAWLGSLTLALDEWMDLVEFRRGFPHTLAVDGDKPHAVKMLCAAPQLATVRTLLFNLSDETPLPVELLRSEAMKRVTGVGWLRALAFRQLLTSKEPWPFTALVCSEPDYDEVARDVDLLCDSTAIPHVRSLKVSGYSIKPAQLAPLWKSALGKRLSGFGSTQGLYRLPEWVTEIEAHGLDARLSAIDLGFNFGANDFAAHLTRGNDGRLSDLEVWKRPKMSSYGAPKISELVTRLLALPKDRLTAFRYVGKLVKADRKLLDEALSRQDKLSLIDLR